MVLGVGGPESAKLTRLATVGVDTVAGLLTARAINQFSSFLLAALRRMRSPRTNPRMALLIRNDDSDHELEMKGKCSFPEDTDWESSNDFRHEAQHKWEMEFR